MGKVSEIREVQLDTISKYGNDCEASINNISQLFSSSSGNSADLIAIRDGLKGFIERLKGSRKKLRDVHSDLRALGAKPITTSIQKHENELIKKIDNSYKFLISIAQERSGASVEYADEFPASASYALSLDVPNSNINLVMYGHTGKAPLTGADIISILDDSDMIKYPGWDDTGIAHLDAEPGQSTTKLLPCIWVGPICIPLGPIAGGIIKGLSRCKGTNAAKCKCICEKKLKKCIDAGEFAWTSGAGTNKAEYDDKITRCYNAHEACKGACG
jgi:hypothetical protein